VGFPILGVWSHHRGWPSFLLPSTSPSETSHPSYYAVPYRHHFSLLSFSRKDLFPTGQAPPFSDFSSPPQTGSLFVREMRRFVRICTHFEAQHFLFSPLLAFKVAFNISCFSETKVIPQRLFQCPNKTRARGPHQSSGSLMD